MTTPAPQKPSKHLRMTDIRSIAQLATQATTGVIRIVEGVHQSVWSTLGVSGGQAPGQTGGITGLVYKCVHAVTKLVGKGVDTALAQLQPLLESAEKAEPGTPQREAVVAALNGVMGDRLAATDNAFATPMSLRYQGHRLNWPMSESLGNPSGKLMLMIHGLCLNDLQWQAQHRRQPFNHAEVLATKLDYNPVYLHYNSGLHVSQNGRQLAAQLEQLVENWSGSIDELSVIAHSMGGLLIRSACYYAKQQGLSWPGVLKNIVFLGTPHHGAPLERAGNWLDVILGSTPYTAPFARLVQLRSAGITDLRYGYLLDQDWHAQNRFQRAPDNRRIVPLPEAVNCYVVAATTADKATAVSSHLSGDGLVPLHSALALDRDGGESRLFSKSSQWIVYRTKHMALLNSPEVNAQILKWLAPANYSDMG